MQTETVRVEIADHIATVTMDHPPVNAQNRQFHEDMMLVFDRLSDMDEVRVAVLTGAGKCFSAGADLKARQAPREPGDAWQHNRRARECFHAIMECRKPVIAAINGPALGAGLAVAASCDILLAAEEASVGLPEIDVGLMGGGRHAMRLFGHSTARRMLLTGYRVPGPELYRLGVVEACVPRDRLMETAMDLARQIAAKSPLASVTAKHALNTIEEMSLRDGYRFEQNMTVQLSHSEDAKEAARAFLEKRAPVFKGRSIAMKPANEVLSGYGTTVFEVMSRLAIEQKSINLGQGFPDEDGPESLKREADRAAREHPNQYPPMMGLPELRQAVAAHGRRFYGVEADWQREIMVTSGATEALAASILALVEPGDEVVLFEPLYDSYLPMLRRAGARPRLVRLEPPDWALPREALADAFSDATKLVLLNTPMNPSGKVFAEAELRFIAELLERHDAYAICDEVYEHITFDGRPHVPLMTLPGMRERCVRIGSAGKTFSMTGWKVGYVTAAPALLSVIAKAHQFLVFTTPPNLQRAVAYGLEREAPWYTGLAASLQAKRDRLAEGLARIGFAPVPCGGTYFLNADYRPLGFDGDDDVAFCRWLTLEAGVTVLPVSALYAEGSVRHLVRFCFCKQDAVLDGALERLQRAFLAPQRGSA